MSDKIKRWRRPAPDAASGPPASGPLTRRVLRSIPSLMPGFQWAGYRKACVPADAGPEQVVCTRDAFYGGFLAAFGLTSRLGEADISEADAFAAFDRINAELDAYFKAARARNG